MSIPWVSIGSKWLRENAPVSKEFALIELTKLMPLGVRSGKRCCDTTTLAKESIKRAYKKRLCDLPDPLPKLENRQMKTGTTEKLKELSSRTEGLTKEEAKEIKNGRKIAFDLVKRKVLVFDGKVYRINSGESKHE